MASKPWCDYSKLLDQEVSSIYLSKNPPPDCFSTANGPSFYSVVIFCVCSLSHLFSHRCWPHVQGSCVRSSIISMIFTSEHRAILHRVPDHFVVPRCRFEVKVRGVFCDVRGIIVSHGWWFWILAEMPFLSGFHISTSHGRLFFTRPGWHLCKHKHIHRERERFISTWVT